jgi:L-lactate dehydrogenase complex protein LldG
VVPEETDMFEMFKARAEAVSAQVHRFPGKPQALEFIIDFLKKEGIAAMPGARAVWARSRFLDGLDTAQIAQTVPGLTFDVTREVAASSKVGISQMDWSVANTGTIVQVSTAVEQRLVSTLPIVHIAIAPSSRIVADLPALLAKLSPRDHSYLAFITGPSRTADIERVLTIGVHGPERLIIAFVDDL